MSFDNGATTFSITTFNRKPYFATSNTNDAQHNNLPLLWVSCYAECRVLFNVMLIAIMLSVVMLSVVMQSVAMLSVVMMSIAMLNVLLAQLCWVSCRYAKCHILFIVMLNVIMLSVAMLNVIILSVVMLSVEAPGQLLAMFSNFPWQIKLEFVSGEFLARYNLFCCPSWCTSCLEWILGQNREY